MFVLFFLAVVALYDYTKDEDNELTFTIGDFMSQGNLIKGGIKVYAMEKQGYSRQTMWKW